MALGATVKVKMDTSAVSRGIDTVQRGLGRIKQSGAQAAQGIAKIGKGMMKAGPLAAVGAAAGVGVALKQALDFGVDLNREMKRLGLSSREVLTLREAFRMVTGEADEAADVIADMQQRIGEAKRMQSGPLFDLGEDGIFEKATIEKLFNQTTAEQFETIMKTIAGLKELDDRQVALDAVFGGAGLKMLGFVDEFNDEMEKAAETVDGLADTITGKGLRGAVAIERSFGKVRAELQRLSFGILQKLPLEKIANMISNIDTGPLLRFIDTVINEIGRFFNNPAESFRRFKDFLFEVAQIAGTKIAEGISSSLSFMGKKVLDFTDPVKTLPGMEDRPIESGILKRLMLPGLMGGQIFDAANGLLKQLNNEVTMLRQQSEEAGRQNQRLLHDIAKGGAAYA